MVDPISPVHNPVDCYLYICLSFRVFSRSQIQNVEWRCVENRFFFIVFVLLEWWYNLHLKSLNKQQILTFFRYYLKIDQLYKIGPIGRIYPLVWLTVFLTSYLVDKYCFTCLALFSYHWFMVWTVLDIYISFSYQHMLTKEVTGMILNSVKSTNKYLKNVCMTGFTFVSHSNSSDYNWIIMNFKLPLYWCH